LEKSVCRGMPQGICTTHIVAHRWGCGGGEGDAVRPLPGLVYSGAWGGRGWSVPAKQLWPLFFPIDLSAWEPD
jgi:hypothetical protein